MKFILDGRSFDTTTRFRYGLMFYPQPSKDLRDARHLSRAAGPNSTLKRVLGRAKHEHCKAEDRLTG
jgi:hypothetical protein